MVYSNEVLINMDPIEVYELLLSGKINRFPKYFFKRDNVIDYDLGSMLLRYLIEKKLHWTDEDICNKLSVNTFKDNGLYGVLNHHFDYSPYKAINFTYPDKFKPWELKQCLKKYWNLDTAKESTIWLIEEKLNWSDEDICGKLNLNVFIENGLYGMIQRVFSESIYDAVNNAYPNRFKPWQLKCVPHKYWCKETAREATIWLFEEKLGWSEEDICNKICKDIFYKNNLSGVFTTFFNSNILDVLENAYPGKYIKVGKKIQLAK